MHIWYVFFWAKKDSSSFYNFNFFIQSHNTARSYQLVNYILVYILSDFDPMKEIHEYCEQ
jgi:hypothetical protein